MPQNTERSTIEVSLTGPADWDSWDHQFKIKAVAARLWEHIDQDEPLLKKPKMPLIELYQREANARPPAASTRARPQTVEQPGESSQSGDQSQTIEPDDDQVPTGDLTAKARATLQLDMQYYTQAEKEFREQDGAVQKLKKWVTDTVVPHYVEVACGATESLAQWYRNLKEHVGISDIRSQISAREQYKEALKPLTKSKDWSNWLSNWEKAISLAQKKKVPEALSTTAWITDFLLAVRPIAEHWTTSYRITQKKQIEKGLITFREIANDFREEIGSMRFGQKGRVPTIAKGAFGPSFAGQDNPDQDATGDAQRNSVEVASGRRARPSGKRTRLPDEDTSLSGRSCVACGLPHPVTRCYYVFPEKAPQWFVENPELRSAVESLLKSDSALQEQVRQLRTKRSRSTSANQLNKPKVVEEDD